MTGDHENGSSSGQAAREYLFPTKRVEEMEISPPEPLGNGNKSSHGHLSGNGEDCRDPEVPMLETKGDHSIRE